MLTKITINNFKRFEKAEIELGKAVVFIGPNNSGKTTALQALVLWSVGLNEWNTKRTGKASPQKRPGVTINRKDLVSIPVPVANMLWYGLHVRGTDKQNAKQRTRNIRIDVAVDGITNGKMWSCGFEFDYSNDQSFVCRPLRKKGYENEKVSNAEFTFKEVPDEVKDVKVAFLPPMSGLSDREFLKQQGEIAFLIGQGQTAQVLRNLCLQVFQQDDKTGWDNIVDQIEKLFGVKLCDPAYVERSGIVMEYEENGVRLDLSSSGRGLQQTLLLLTHLYANPNTILLLDEPDAHLEILRQRQIFTLITETAEKLGAQVIIASHSEVVLNEAAGKGKVVAFLGKPHVINDKGSQLLKSLNSIGWEQYYQAEETGWVLYLENSTDLSILQTFANCLGHPAVEYLQRPFVYYVATNVPQKARDHFFGLKEAKSDLVGLAIFDRLESQLQSANGLEETMWKKREIENYFCSPEVLLDYAKQDQPKDLFELAEVDKRVSAMQESIEEVSKLLEIDAKSIWSPDVKATDEVLDRIFRQFFKKLKLPLEFRKADYYTLAKLVPKEKMDSEIIEKLDLIVKVAKKAKSREKSK